MNTITLETKDRQGIGTKYAKMERQSGQIPCVLYGGKENRQFTVNSIAFEKLISTPEVDFIELKHGGESLKAVIKDVQFHPTTDHVLHVDFEEMVDGKPVTMKLPIRLTGNSIGQLNGGKLLQKLRRIEVKSMPEALPAEIVVDVTPMRIGESIKVADLAPIKGLTFLAPSNSVVCLVKVIRGLVESAVTEEVAAGAEGKTEEAKAEGAENKAEEKPAE